MDILENSLIRKYFYEGPGINYVQHILDAMQQPIRKGERYLAINGAETTESICGHEIGESLHTNCLRLPDAFQKQGEEYCGFCKEHLQSVLQCHCTPIKVPTPSPEPRSTCPACFPKVCPVGGHNPSPETCFCGGDDIAGQVPMEGHDTHRPKDAVEEKIEMIVWENGSLGETDKRLEVKLRDLVRLARETK